MQDGRVHKNKGKKNEYPKCEHFGWTCHTIERVTILMDFLLIIEDANLNRKIVLIMFHWRKKSRQRTSLLS